jgi:hypothetical protein
MIQREVFAWGVRLSVRPFADSEYQNLEIVSEVSHYKPGRGSEIRITFTGVSVTPLRIIDAQTWREALDAIINETRSLAAEMKTAAAAKAEKPESKPESKPDPKPTKVAKPKTAKKKR